MRPQDGGLERVRGGRADAAFEAGWQGPPLRWSLPGRPEAALGDGAALERNWTVSRFLTQSTIRLILLRWIETLQISSAATVSRSRRSAWPFWRRCRVDRTARRTTSPGPCGPRSASSPARRCTTPSASWPTRASSGASSPPGSPARYEDRAGDNHHHLICRTCGRMVDVDCAVGAAPCLTPADDSGFEIDEAEVIYWGRCPECLAHDPAPAGDRRGDRPRPTRPHTSDDSDDRPSNSSRTDRPTDKERPTCQTMPASAR